MARFVGPRGVLIAASFVFLAVSITATAALAGPFWRWFAPAEPSPGARQQHVAVFDPIGNQMIVFGGADTLGDTWSVSMQDPYTWRRLNVGTPGGRRGASAVYDPIRHRVLLFGGYDGTWRNDLWSLPLDGTGVWTRLLPGGTPPSPRMSTPFAYDAVHDRVIMFGGWDGTRALSDTWYLTLTVAPSWTQVPIVGPPARFGHVAFHEPGSDVFYVFGGSGATTYSDLWSLRTSPPPFWNAVTTTGDRPRARYYAAGTFLPQLKTFYMFGGLGVDAATELYSLDLNGAPDWSYYTNAGTPPPGVYLHTMVYDSIHGQILLYQPAGRIYALEVANPLIATLSVPAGRVGDPVQIRGTGLGSVSTVTFGGGVPAAIEHQAATTIDVHVPAGAVTGPITVGNLAGFAMSPGDFFVGEVPVVASVSPDSGVAGDAVVIRGAHFTGTTQVAFGANSRASFQLIDDARIDAVVDGGATSGPVSVANPVGTGTSSIPFRVLDIDPSARIVSVRDVRGDQGGRVSVKWTGSRFDTPERGGVAMYRLWRRAPLADFVGRKAESLRAEVPGFWEPVGEVPAIRIGGYAFTASTPSDSTAGGNPYTAFFVQTVTDTPGVFYLSPVDSGYSVDNLAPAAPSLFNATYTPLSTVLHWKPARESDFREYRVFRGTLVDFPMDAEHLLMTTRDTTATDAPGSWYYKLVALDVHGNRSRAALVSPDAPVATVAALVSSEALADRVRLTWYADGLQGSSMVLERRAADGPWLSVATLSVDGEGYLRHEDRDVEAGGSYGYRLVYTEEGVETRTPETRVLVPGPVLAIELVRPNPGASRDVEVVFRFPGDQPVRAEVLDVTGRRWAVRRFERGTAGRQTWRPAAGSPWPAGLYLVRVSRGADTRTTRFVIVE